MRASQGTRRAGMLGVLDILLVCFFRQVKKSDSPIKGEKRIAIQSKINNGPCSAGRNQSAVRQHNTEKERESAVRQHNPIKKRIFI